MIQSRLWTDAKYFFFVFFKWKLYSESLKVFYLFLDHKTLKISINTTGPITAATISPSNAELLHKYSL